jgi:hypothetical protein
MWDAQDGLYYDYNFAHKTVRRYPFLTTFYPLWAGIATKEQAAAVEKNVAKFERPGGLATSTFESGNQWDLPFGWAPLEMIAVEGLRRYGFNADADRISGGVPVAGARRVSQSRLHRGEVRCGAPRHRQQQHPLRLPVEPGRLRLDQCGVYAHPCWMNCRTRNLLMHLALTGLFRAKWSAAVHEEWIGALLRRRPDLSRKTLERTRMLMDLHAADALVTG